MYRHEYISVPWKNVFTNDSYNHKQSSYCTSSVFKSSEKKTFIRGIHTLLVKYGQML